MDNLATCGLSACTQGSAQGPTLGNKYRKPLEQELKLAPGVKGFVASELYCLYVLPEDNNSIQVMEKIGPTSSPNNVTNTVCML